MKKYLVVVAAVLILFGCSPRSPASPPPRPPAGAPAGTPTAATPVASAPVDIQAIYDEYLARQARGDAAQKFVSSLKPPVRVIHLGKGIWELKGQGRWLIKEVGRSVQPLDDEAREVLRELQVLGPSPTPRPSPAPIAPGTPVATPAPRAGATPTPTATPPGPAQAPKAAAVTTRPPPATAKPLAPPPGWPNYTNATWRFSMNYPPGWTIDESWPGEWRLKSPGGEAMIIIQYAWKSKGLDQWVDESVYRVSRKYWDYEFLHKEKFARGEWEGWLIAYRGRPSFTPMSEYRDLLVSDGVVQFWISASTQGNAAVEIPPLELALRSFQFLPGITATPVPWWYIP